MKSFKFWFMVIVGFTLFTVGAPLLGVYCFLRESFKYPSYMFKGYKVIWNDIKNKVQV